MTPCLFMLKKRQAARRRRKEAQGDDAPGHVYASFAPPDPVKDLTDLEQIQAFLETPEDDTPHDD